MQSETCTEKSCHCLNGSQRTSISRLTCSVCGEGTHSHCVADTQCSHAVCTAGQCVIALPLACGKEYTRQLTDGKCTNTTVHAYMHTEQAHVRTQTACRQQKQQHTFATKPSGTQKSSVCSAGPSGLHAPAFLLASDAACGQSLSQQQSRSHTKGCRLHVQLAVRFLLVGGVKATLAQSTGKVDWDARESVRQHAARSVQRLTCCPCI